MATFDNSEPVVAPNGFASLMQRLEVDRAVVFMVLARLIQIGAFPVTMALITRCLTAETQGFYYTFGSVLALQMFFELGFTYVIINVASHEWAMLSLDEHGAIVGDPRALSRLVSLGRLIFKWYAAAALLFVAGGTALGWWFFSGARQTAVHWQSPLTVLVVLSGFLLWTLPFNALLEGCNQVVNINKLRVTQTLFENLALWTTLLLGGGLWAAAAAVSAKLLRDVYLLFVQYRNFFKPFYSLQTDHHVSWRNEIWPMQWRLAIAGVATYFAASLYNPVMFRYHGAAVAGQMGMTIQMVNGMQLVPMAWVLTKVPRYGMLIARGDYGALDRLWLRNSVISIVIALFGCGGVLGVVYVLRAGGFAIARRILSPLPIALLLAGAVLLQAVQCFVAYLRAHKQEPIFVANIVMALSAGAMVWILGSRVGPAGAAVANVIQMIATFIWIGAIWWRCRVRWHAPAGEQRA